MLVLAATPIGDVADAPPRLAAELAGADVIAAEDTRRLRRLLDRLGITTGGPDRLLLRGQRGGAHPRAGRARSRTAPGCCWSPTPACRRSPTPATGWSPPPSSAASRSPRCPARPRSLTALALSGLPVDRFCFEGFLPRKAGERRAPAGRARRRAAHDGLLRGAAPHRRTTSAAMAEAFGPDRRAAVCRELTKTYEEVRRGPLAELRRGPPDGVRGEITLVVAGAAPRPADLDGRRGGAGATRGAAADASRPSPRSRRARDRQEPALRGHCVALSRGCRRR